MDFRERALAAMGGFPEKVPLDIKYEKEQKFDGYTGYVLNYNLEENECTNSILLVPDGITEKTPAILAIHQHNGEYHLGKAEPSAWDITGKIKELNPMYAYGRDLVKRGYIVICPDLLCFEERRDPHFGISEEFYPGYNYEVFEFTKRIQEGSSLMAKYLYDMSVAIDVLCQHDKVDITRIGVIGHSLGGQTSLYTTWYDQRVKVGASSCGFSTVASIIRDKVNHNKAMYIPGFSKFADTDDILCDIAPRAFTFTSGISDSIFPLDGVREIEANAKEKYTSLDVPDKFMSHIFNGGHCFNDQAKEKVYNFIDKELKINY